MINKEYWFWLCNLDGIGVKKIQAILDFFETPEQVFMDKGTGLNQIGILTDADKDTIINSKEVGRIQENYAKLISKGIYFVTKEEAHYPSKLHNIYNPPYGLYVKGKLPEENRLSIAIVGARNCSDYGKETAGYISYELASAGVQIISGLARGIDGYAHDGALAAGGYTCAVEGCSVDICYPKENFNIYMEMQQKGGIVSEYGLNCYPKACNFPIRNRLISGMSDGILIIEAKEKSGSLITVDMGLEQGKNIYSIPGRINDLLSAGCNNLIKIGAKMVTGPEDILDDYGIIYKNCKNQMKKIDKLLETKEKIVYACLSFFPKHMNEIAGETNLSIMELTEILVNLELKNYIKQIRKNYYVYIS
ncbi:DNA-protecting protein DprA [Anaerocolumna sedimenticola]|uniref:DNA-protecting protein DprA n=1 Tax=Anaerocolumna sedimenticola TaxID=2696063 RepID=A0A6P1TRB2_9FIRM|nr:DNA-processing protein DprA [Anaerocolumna sedimenticola]QHQ62065.1 DNA-protecting protein DprA [Anaerocolumna sedimenticola]